MTDMPIPFKAPMVRAIFDGRKTQTRIALNPQPIMDRHGVWHWDGRDGGFVGASAAHVKGIVESMTSHCRFAPGDRLWVRETWQAVGSIRDFRHSRSRVGHAPGEIW